MSLRSYAVYTSNIREVKRCDKQSKLWPFYLPHRCLRIQTQGGVALRNSQPGNDGGQIMTIGSSFSPMRVSAFPKAVLFSPPPTSCGLVIIRLLMLRVIPANGFSLVKSSWPGSYVNLSLSLHLLAVWISGSCGRRVYAEACPGNAGVFF